MQRRCYRCAQSHNGPQAFLLTCRDCSRTWHHRCHIPPIEDAELIQRIRATNAGDTEHDLRAWSCRRCSAKRPAHPAPPPTPPTLPTLPTPVDSEAMDVDTPHTSSAAEPSSRPASVPPSAPDVDVHGDDDLYGPPVERRVVRIYPSLAEELREQSRQERGDRSTTKMKQRPSLAPQWILERHARDPQWVDRRHSDSRRRRRGGKAHAKRLGHQESDDIVLSHFTVGHWLKHHKRSS